PDYSCDPSRFDSRSPVLRKKLSGIHSETLIHVPVERHRKTPRNRRTHASPARVHNQSRLPEKFAGTLTFPILPSAAQTKPLLLRPFNWHTPWPYCAKTRFWFTALAISQ